MRISLRRTAAGAFACLAALAVLTACGSSDDKAASDGDLTSADAGSDGPYEVDDCAGLDPDRAPDGYKQFDCDDAGASLKVIALQPANFAGLSEPNCPIGTDTIITVETTYGSTATSGIPSQTLCARNLTGDHPGDPGMGGGQLKEQDCVSADLAEIPCAGAPAGALAVVSFATSVSECPAEATDPIELQFQVGRDYNVICAAAL